LYLPVAHAAQAEADVDPVIGLAVPVAQSVHVAWPVAELYLPAVQSTQADAREEPLFGFALPIAHATHAADEVEPVAVL